MQYLSNSELKQSLTTNKRRKEVNMIIVLATFEQKEGVKVQMHVPLNDVEITKLPLSDKEEVMIFERLEKEYPDYIPVSIDSITWQP